jgi:cytochrome c553
MSRSLCAAALAAVFLSACGQQATVTSATALVERGDYLVNGVVLCGDCHTPRLENGELDMARSLQGGHTGAPPPMADLAPEIAGIPPHFTQNQFVAFLQTGVRPDGSHPLPPMPPYRLNDEDARAVAAYIATLPRTQEQTQQ